jgi:hypothetical protein
VRGHVEWRAALAVYTGAFAIVTTFSVLTSLAHLQLLWLRLGYYGLALALFWIVAWRVGFPNWAAAGSAIAGTLLGWMLNSWSLVAGFSLRALAGADPSSAMLWVSGVGLIVLIVLLAGWGWRDGRWVGLLWLAGFEMVASLAVLYATPGLEGVRTWVFLVTALPGSWDAGLRLLVAWLLATLAVLWVARLRPDWPQGSTAE